MSHKRFTVHIYDTVNGMNEVESFTGVIATTHEAAIKFGIFLWKMEKGRMDMMAFSATEIQDSKRPISTWDNWQG